MHTARTLRPRTLGALSAMVAAAVGGTALLAPPASATDDPAKDRDQYHTVDVLFRGANQESLNGVSYHTFRIPAIVRTNAGTLLAFAEGRAKSNKDYGNINLLYKRGVRNGARPEDWSGLKEAVGSGMGTWGNPTPVVDRSNGTIWLFLSWNAADKSQSGGDNPDTGDPTTAITKWGERRVYVMKSTDDGQSFTGANGESAPTDMTGTLLPEKKADGKPWAWDAMGPGAGLYMDNGTIVIPAQHRNIYSTDHGRTWKVQKLGEETGEATVTQLDDGSLYRNDRPTGNSWNQHKRRWVARGGLTGQFGAYTWDDQLLDPKNQASVLHYNNTEPDAPRRTLFLNSASTETRQKMRVRVSYDNARTWERSRPFSEGPKPPYYGGAEGGYSSMAKTADNMVGALVESNLNTDDKASSRSILFRKFNIPWVVNGCTC
ncbi:sialidase family protein [Actinomadura terrae]|uniref:sialidase family protein n=1 Tax=Actinomadura terrae TaxID=604353 RepID=UPI001FA6FA8D|nr:sialidase family protein [Actinomadura terrae]